MKASDEASNSSSPAISTEARYALISAALGCLGMINMVLIGVHVVVLYLRLAQLGRFFLIDACIVGGITTASTLALFYGSYLAWKKEGQRGGLLNLAGGIVTLILFCYFTWFFPLLRQFEPMGYLLPIPALISGFLALFMLKNPPNHLKA